MMLTLPAIAAWPNLAAVWLADGTASIDPAQYGIAGVVFAIFGGVILKMLAQARTDRDNAIIRADTSITQMRADRDAALARSNEERDEALRRSDAALEQERERADRLEAALARVNAEFGPRQAAAMDNAMKAVTDAIRELKR